MADWRAVPEFGGRGLAPWQIKLALGLMSRDLCADIPTTELARRCGLSRSYFIRAFKISMGTPPHRWLVRQRILQAEEMLEWTGESISAIAASCGFSDQSHFTRTFQAVVGSSPGAWRRRRRAGAAIGDIRRPGLDAGEAPPPGAGTA